MHVKHQVLTLESKQSFQIIDITVQVNEAIRETGIKNGIAIITSQHTTTALTVNEYEERLLVDIEQFFVKLAPADAKYLHNDLHLRDVPPDEPENAHSHLAAMLLGNHESIAIVDGKLQLGTYQSVMLVELDGARSRKVSIQLVGM